MPPSVEAMKAMRPSRAVDQQREVELALDVAAVLDVEALDRLAGRAGLLGDQRHGRASSAACCADLLDRLGEAHAALAVGIVLELALAAAAGVDLRLHDGDGLPSLRAASMASSVV